MENTAEPLVVGVRFSKVGKIYHFTSNDMTEIKVGDMVVVETSRGWQLGQVAQIIQDAPKPPDGWKSLDRRATPRDLLMRQMWQMKESEVVTRCKAKASDLCLVGIKIISAEYSFDGSRLTILFSSETEEKYDLKSLRQDMQKMFAPSQVEMRQIGPRDVAKTVCGMGACGLETRCCCLFLTEFSSISIRMAKEQGISLTPTEITGMCGRLRCCLIYEYDTYVDARSKLPKRNKRVRTPQGEGKVVDVIPLRESVIVDLPEVGHREFSGSEVTLVEDGGVPQPVQPYRGTQQPSEIDQAITGVEEETPFTIAPDVPRQESDRTGDRPETGGQPRGGQQRSARPRDQRPHRPEQRHQPRERTPNQEPQSGPQGGSADTPQGGEQPGGTPRQPRSGRPRPDRPGPKPGEQGRRDHGQGSQSQPPQQGGPVNPKGETPGGGGQAGRGPRDQRRRKGRRRNSNDNETRA
jgi:cell fate regulator YaaT (PSP1 superfamily)